VSTFEYTPLLPLAPDAAEYRRLDLPAPCRSRSQTLSALAREAFQDVCRI
jgi:hypothetical protein